MTRQPTPHSDAPPAGPFPPDRPAWTSDALAHPHARADKPERVRRMFAAIAPSYDLNNRLHSLWRDQAWRRFAVRAADVRPGDRVLDVACGTGDLAEVFAAGPAAEVVGLDFTPQMLDVARARRNRLNHARARKLAYVEGDALALPFPDASFDVVSIAFGLRNVADPARALAEFARVLRPHGRLVILEFGQPSTPPLSWLYRFYSGWLMPRTASLIAGDRSGAYRYLPRSVATFLGPGELTELLAGSGFADPTLRRLTLGVCLCYRALRSEPAPTVPT
ncbi:MAG: bifunctional demethylmenaquinone methyltransferase/2-methoxy-6-polyprenyl-1,4-benzoquinol methylase UbiE [Phycisphaerae bacterium]|nr:bifunctional demethylmenaquinone methyltransferase/2-methoxy-6-polyprenyl-1,4-benzoquinol methylase UbiE [Phycisphaerae bacterium]